LTRPLRANRGLGGFKQGAGECGFGPEQFADSPYHSMGQPCVEKAPRLLLSLSQLNSTQNATLF